ncbi:acyl-ACP--UDP-N-acetylglucosamine O-acyltransferase [soil metagenome]
MPAAPLIHATAVIGPDAILTPDVTVGPFAVIDGPVTLGAGCKVGPHAHILGRVTFGIKNDIGSGTVIGGPPQHRAYNNEDTGVVIGDNNVFREHVTIHRGMPNAKVMTCIGSNNYFMAGSHVAHDCTVGNNCNFANAALIAGHVTVDDGVFLSGNTAVHQNCHIGRLALLSGVSAATQDIPPFWMVQARNMVVGINVIGMRRAGIPAVEIAAVRAAFKLLYTERLPIREATLRMEAKYNHIPAVMEIVAFIRTSKRGVPGAHQFRGEDRAAA